MSQQVTLDLFRQYGIICVSVGPWNLSSNMTLFVFLLDLELFRQSGIIGFSMGL
jgi:hypothetical protein